MTGKKNDPDLSTKARLKRVYEYCSLKGIAPSTLGVKAAENSKLIARIEAREERQDEQLKKIEAFMNANPPCAPYAG